MQGTVFLNLDGSRGYVCTEAYLDPDHTVWLTLEPLIRSEIHDGYHRMLGYEIYGDADQIRKFLMRNLSTPRIVSVGRVLDFYGTRLFK